MAKVVHSAAALEDLSRLVELIEGESPRSGAGVIGPILQAIGMLGAHPMLGRRVGGTRRELVISRGKAGYIATYRFDPVHDIVRILRIRHQHEAGYLD